MGYALETLSVSDTDTTLGDLSVVAGSSLTVKNGRGDSPIYVVDFWQTNSSGGEAAIRMRSPRLHDNVDNFRHFAFVTNPQRLWPLGALQPLIPQDTLQIEGNVVTSGRITASVTLFYTDLPGSEARLVNWTDIQRRIKNILALRQDVGTNTTAGAYSQEQGIASDQDLLKANVDYAVLGITAEAALHQLGIRGPDTGNLRVGVPFDISLAQESARYFVLLNQLTGLPTIPIINAANKSATLVDWLDNVAAQTDASVIVAELS